MATALQVSPSPWLEVTLGQGIGVPVAIGGELTPEALIGAYRRGMFCQPRSSAAAIAYNETVYGPDVQAGHIPVIAGRGNPYGILWWSPQDRYVIPVGSLRIGRTLRRTIRACPWKTTMNTAFDAVIAGCRGEREPRWLTDEMVAVLGTLHAMGWTKTVEVWEGSELVGGLFGCAVGQVFIMESAFHARPDAAKVAITDVERRAAAAGFTVLDAQVRTDYTVRMGAHPIPRGEFLSKLGAVGERGPLDGNAREAHTLIG